MWENEYYTCNDIFCKGTLLYINATILTPWISSLPHKEEHETPPKECDNGKIHSAISSRKTKVEKLSNITLT